MVNQEASGRRVFPAVAAVERFCVLHLGGPTDSPIATSMLNFGVSGAQEGAAHLWSQTDLRIVSPRTSTVLSTGDEDEIRLALDLHGRFGTLDFSEPDGSNPYHLKYSRLFDSSIAKAKGWLYRPDALEARGYALGPDQLYRHQSLPTMVPVLEGQLANRWNHRARTYEGYIGAGKYGRKPNAPVSNSKQLEDPAYEIMPRYWMPIDVAAARISDVADADDVFMGMRKIGRPWTDRRLLRAMLLPKYPATDALPVFAVPKPLVFAALAVLNSMTMDFLMRIRMATGNIPPWLLSQCASPMPDQVPQRAQEIAARLSVTSASVSDSLLEPIATWDEPEREALDAECDAWIAVAYGLTIMDYELVLNHFKLLERIETREVGEYRSKRLRLEAFEEIGGGR